MIEGGCAICECVLCEDCAIYLREETFLCENCSSDEIIDPNVAESVTTFKLDDDEMKLLNDNANLWGDFGFD